MSVAVDAEQALSDLDKVIDIQCANGNWNYDAYMHGLANGLIMARSCLTGEEPKFLAAPEEWLCDRKLDGPAEQVVAGATQ